MDDDFDRQVLAAIGGAAATLVDRLSDAAVQPGQRISHYRIIERVGEGGMGVVCKALDEKLDRLVALKLLMPTHSDAALRERLEREARAASALNHPSICTVHDFDEHDHHHFIVMEFLEGETLKQRLARGPLNEGEAIAVASRIAAALGAAHAAGLVHCDIKPANVFLTNRGEAKVLDFGIAKFLREIHDGGPSSSSSASGTRAYMSPEQASGSPVDQRTDVYSLGAVIAEMVASPGRPLSQLIAAMQHADRDQRLADMTAVAKGLDRVRTRRARVRAMLAAAAIVMLAALPAWIFRPQPPALAERDWLLVGAIENKTPAPVFDDLLDDVVSVQVSQSPYFNVFAGARLQDQLALMRHEPGTQLTPALAREVAMRAGVPVVINGSIAAVGNRFVISLDAVNVATGDYLAREQAEAASPEGVVSAVGQSASALRRRLGESAQSIARFSAPVETATTSSLEALRAYHEGQQLMAQGTSAAIKAIPFYLRAIELDPEFALAHSRLATAYESVRESRRAELSAAEAFRLRARVSERERYQIMARYYGQVSGAVSLAIEALEMWVKTYPDDATAHNSLATYLKNIGQLERAAALTETAVKLSPRSATYRANLAGGYLRLTNVDRAARVCEDAVRDQLDNSTTHRFLHTIAFLRGDAAAMAREEAWRARATSDYANMEYSAGLAAATGRLRAARDGYAQAIALLERQKLDDRSAQNQVRLALLEAYIGDRQRALSLGRGVLDGEVPRAVAAEAAIALAMAGDDAGSTSALDRLARQYPQDETIGRLWAPLAAAITAMRSGRHVDAIQRLKLLQSYDRGDDALMRPSFHLGLAHLSQKSAADAKAAFQRVADNRGVVVSSPVFALAQLGLARAARLEGQVDLARRHYARFFELWADADQQLPIVQEARREATRFTSVP